MRGNTARLFDKWIALYLNVTRVRFERFGPPQEALFSRFGKPAARFGLAGGFAALLRSCRVQNGPDESGCLFAPPERCSFIGAWCHIRRRLNYAVLRLKDFSPSVREPPRYLKLLS